MQSRDPKVDPGDSRPKGERLSERDAGRRAVRAMRAMQFRTTLRVLAVSLASWAAFMLLRGGAGTGVGPLTSFVTTVCFAVVAGAFALDGLRTWRLRGAHEIALAAATELLCESEADALRVIESARSRIRLVHQLRKVSTELQRRTKGADRSEQERLEHVLWAVEDAKQLIRTEIDVHTERHRGPRATGDADAVASLIREGTIRLSSSIEDAGDWLERLLRWMRCVCAIEVEVSPGRWAGAGTGILVHEELVLTSFHVVERVAHAERFESQRVRFRFHRRDDADPRIEFACVELVAHSPTVDLDFAVLKLGTPSKRALAIHVSEQGKLIDPPATPRAAPRDSVLVLQHPEAGPLRLSLGSVMRADGQFVRHDASTNPGSSGGACLSASLELYGVHCGHEEGRANVVIPFSSILGAWHAAQDAHR